MAYCTLDDIKKKLSEDDLIGLTDDKNTGKIDEAIVADAITEACSEIDGYCGIHYAVPFEDTKAPTVIINLSKTITVFNLYARRQGAPDDWQKRYDNSVKLLSKIADGTIKLTIPNQPDPMEKQKDRVLFDAPARIFTREKLERF